MRVRAFTVIELIIVMTMIAALAAIAVPNFLRAQVLAKVARSRADMATIIVALEDYHVDHGMYPPNIPAAEAALRGSDLTPRTSEFEGVIETDAFEELMQLETATTGALRLRGGYRYPRIAPQVTGYALFVLTTPVSYAAPVFRDPFSVHRELEGGLFGYANWEGQPGGGLQFAPDSPTVPLVLVGVGPGSARDMALPTNLGYIPYDPTNGTTSRGDILEHPR